MRDEKFSEFVLELKEKNDIVEVIGSYIKLERKGYNNWWACCPFHHEKTPSFSVNAADRFYHCFGCGASGDVIGFVKEYENVDFMQAVQILAARVKLEVPVPDGRDAEESARKKQKKDRLLSLMRDSARFYLNNLYSGRADAHLAYLEKRGLSPSTVKRFGIGASLDYQALPSYLLSHGYTPEECEESGACSKTPDGRLIDAEGERLIIPIINQLDEVIAFGGRIVKESDRAKYKNTRETLLFNKSKNLYNINLVKKERKASGISSLIMVEGYMDAISLYEAGFHNVVASMGTSLTKEQARLCKRYSENVFISYDGDFAGQKANLRGLEILKEEGVKVRVVPMPDGLDPDDVIRQRGADGYRACLDAAMPLIDFRIHATQLKYDLTKTDERRDFVREVLPIVREAETETEREELLKKIAAAASVSYSALVRDLEQVPAEERAAVAPPRPREDNASRERKAVRFVLAACLFSKPYALGFDPMRLTYDDPALEAIADFIVESRGRGKIYPSGIFDIVPSDDPELSEVLNLNDGDTLDGEHAERYFRGCVETLEKQALKEKIAAAQRAYLEATTQEDRRELVALIQEYTKKLNKIGNGGGRG